MLRVKDKFYRPVDPPTPPTSKFAEYLIWYKDPGGNIELGAHEANGDFIETMGPDVTHNSVGRSFYPGPTFSLNEGSRVLTTFDPSRVIVRDWIDEVDHIYVPGAGRLASSAIEINNQIYWFEVEPEVFAVPGSNNTTVRLYRNNEVMTAVILISTFVALLPFSKEVFPDEQIENGADWTNVEAGGGGYLWIKFIDQAGETIRYRRAFLPYDGSSGSLSETLIDPTIDRGPRSGYPITVDETLCVGETGTLNEEDTGIVNQYVSATHDPDTDYSVWGDSPGVVDISLSEDGTLVYMVTGETPYEILIYDADTELIVEAISFDNNRTKVIGIHHLEEPIEFPE